MSVIAEKRKRLSLSQKFSLRGLFYGGGLQVLKAR